MSNQLFKLGKSAPKIDVRTLCLADYITPVLGAPPAHDGWTSGIKSWGMMRNDELGDCTCAAAGHLIELWRAASGVSLVVGDDEVLAAYEVVSGYDPKTGENDNGAVCLDVLNDWRKGQIFGDHPIEAYAQLERDGLGRVNRDQIKDSVWLFGGCYIGVALPLCVQDKRSWTMPLNGIHTKSGEPGSWGGHCVPIVAYDSRGVTVVTWGGLLHATWAFVETYCDEAYAVLSKDWVAGDGKAPDGFDLTQLQADLAAIHKVA